MADFNTAVNIVLFHEGGYVNNPKDRGKETKYGISKATFPHLDIKNLTKEQAKEIYFTQYWNRFRLGEISDQKIANFALDTVVQHGFGVGVLQRALNADGKNLIVDNRMGSKTLAALNSVAPYSFLYHGVIERKKYMEELILKNPDNEEFRDGWFRRVSFFLPDMKTLALSLLALATVIYLVVSNGAQKSKY